MSDTLSKEVKAIISEDKTPLKIFDPPKAQHKYRLVVDPIMSQSAESDLFALCVFDITKAPYRQVATFIEKELPIEDYADIVVNIAKLYNRAEICPEQNIAESLCACIRSLGYYNFFYTDPKERSKKNAGVRTTATSKPTMIDNLKLLLNQKQLVIQDNDILDQMQTFEKKEKHRMDGSITVKMEARKGKRDDLCAVQWIFAGSLRENELIGRKGARFSII